MTIVDLVETTHKLFVLVKQSVGSHRANTSCYFRPEERVRLTRARLAETDAVEVGAIARVFNEWQNGVLKKVFVAYRRIEAFIKIEFILYK